LGANTVAGSPIHLVKASKIVEFFTACIRWALDIVASAKLT
jgi:hypothetical protein